MSREDYVLLLVARDEAEAEYYELLLDDHDINVQVEENDAEEGQGVAILVLNEQLEEAEHIIEQKASIDEELEQDYIRDDEAEEEYDDGDFEISSVDGGEAMELDEFDEHEDGDSEVSP